MECMRKLYTSRGLTKETIRTNLIRFRALYTLHTGVKDAIPKKVDFIFDPDLPRKVIEKYPEGGAGTTRRRYLNLIKSIKDEYKDEYKYSLLIDSTKEVFEPVVIPEIYKDKWYGAIIPDDMPPENAEAFLNFLGINENLYINKTG